MKIISNLWKTGVVLLLSISLLSGSVIAADLSDETEPGAVIEEPETDDQSENETKPADQLENVVETEETGGMQTEEEVEEVSETETEEDDLMKKDQDVLDKVKEETPSSTKEAAPENKEPAIGTVVKSGDCGYVLGTMFYTITYLGDEHYKLTISGTGMMLLITVPYGAPWNKYAAKVTEVEIKDGVEGIREYAFNNFSEVTSLTIPASVNYIEKGSFKMTGLQDVYFLGAYYNAFHAKAFTGTSGVTVHHKEDLSWAGFTFEGTTSQESDISLQKIDAKEPTCGTEGHAAYYYSTTWNKYFYDADAKLEIRDSNDLMIPALGHDWDDGTVTKQPTATEGGIMTYSCTRCDEIRTDAIPAVGENTIPDVGNANPDDTANPVDGIQNPDDQMPGSEMEENGVRGEIGINVNVNFQDKTGSSRTAGTPGQTEKTSAGQVKTADENPYVLYLVLLGLSGIALIAIFRKRILR